MVQEQYDIDLDISSIQTGKICSGIFSLFVQNAVIVAF